MASSGSSGSLADVLLCPVCCEQIKTPKIIYCGHSFCLEPCLRDLLKTSHACPLCRQHIHAPPSGLADDFPTNFVVQALLSTGVTSATKKSQSPPSDTSVDSKTDCVLHQKQGTYFCGTCLEFLCDECNGTHEDGHEVEGLQTITEQKIGELEPLMGKIANSLKIIRERMESVKDAKVKCEGSCQQAESEICDAVSSFTENIQEEGKQRVVEVAKGREVGIKTLDKLEAQLGNAEIAAKRMEGLAALLMTRYRENDIRDTGTFDALTTQQKRMDKELENISAPPDGTVMVKFQSKVRPSNSLGEVKVITQGANQVIKEKGMVTLMQRNSYEGYHGYVWFSLNHLLMAKCNGDIVSFIPFNDGVNTKVSEVGVGINATTVSPVLAEDGRSFLINSLKHVIKLTMDLSTGGASMCKRTIKNAMVYSIAAVCWDAKREGCYVLLHDRITISHLTFGNPDNDSQDIRLDSKVDTPAFHVSEFGGMAFCDNGVVRYYAKVQPHVTRVIPSDSRSGGKANCLTSRGSDRKWFVCRCLNIVIQYSDSFQVEKSFDVGPSYLYGPKVSVMSILFLDERYFVVARTKTLTVYSIEP